MVQISHVCLDKRRKANFEKNDQFGNEKTKKNYNVKRIDSCEKVSCRIEKIEEQIGETADGSI